MGIIPTTQVGFEPTTDLEEGLAGYWVKTVIADPEPEGVTTQLFWPLYYTGIRFLVKPESTVQVLVGVDGSITVNSQPNQV